MTIKEIIERFIHNSEETKQVLTEAQNSGDKLRLLLDRLRKDEPNMELGLHFAELLQLCDDASLLTQFDLSDIQKLFDSLLEAQPENLDVYLEAARFEWSVMNNQLKARQILERGMLKAEQKRSELANLLRSIDEDV